MAEQRALVIDDNVGLAETVGEILSDRGFVVEVASTGIEALVAWRRRPAQLLVVDVDLPDIGGLKLARRLLLRARACRLVVMSARAPEQILPLCEQLGAVLLTKPFSPSHLVATVQLVLRSEARRSQPDRREQRLLGPSKPRPQLQHRRSSRNRS